jgi:hypothetical protein
MAEPMIVKPQVLDDFIKKVTPSLSRFGANGNAVHLKVNSITQNSDFLFCKLIYNNN